MILLVWTWELHHMNDFAWSWASRGAQLAVEAHVPPASRLRSSLKHRAAFNVPEELRSPSTAANNTFFFPRFENI